MQHEREGQRRSKSTKPSRLEAAQKPPRFPRCSKTLHSTHDPCGAMPQNLSARLDSSHVGSATLKSQNEPTEIYKAPLSDHSLAAYGSMMDFEVLENRTLLAGVTILTHGNDGNITGWVRSAAIASIPVACTATRDE